jgi:two-component sensor histidine kinase
MVGCDFAISGTAISSLALLHHELATNSAKHGALSAPSGQIEIHCAEQEETVALTWTDPANAMPLQGLSSSRPTRSMPSEETRMLLV